MVLLARGRAVTRGSELSSESLSSGELHAPYGALSLSHVLSRVDPGTKCSPAPGTKTGLSGRERPRCSTDVGVAGPVSAPGAALPLAPMSARLCERMLLARARPLPLPLLLLPLLLLLLLPLSLPLSLSLVKSPVLVLHESKQLSLSLASLPLPLRFSLVTLPVGVKLDSAECARAADWCGGITVSPNDGSRGSLLLLVWLCIPNSLLCCSVTDEKKVAKKKKMATISFRRKKCVCLQSSLHWTKKKNSVAKGEF